jgi:hypothetical protein
MINFYCTKVRPLIKSIGRAIGVKPRRSWVVRRFPADFDDETKRIINIVNEYTMTSPERVHALIDAVRYVVKNDIEGDIVECGVWRGGSMMAAALTLRELGDESRNFYLYDTFEGMSSPAAADGHAVIRKFNNRKLSSDSSTWARSPIDEVRYNLTTTGYPAKKMHLIKGKVENTLPGQVPVGPIAILRLDTDWYESTRHELLHLYPKLVRNGVLIIDDYGSFPGAKKAVDEFFAQQRVSLLLNRIEGGARIAVKN